MPQVFRFTQQPIVSIFKSQVAFMGVARKPGTQPSYSNVQSWHPKTFTYVGTQTLTEPGPPSASNFVTIRVPITDYDFELHQLILTYENATSVPAFVCLVQLYDMVNQVVSNVPMLDQFINGAPDGLYAPNGTNGAFVPPLIYVANTSIRLDLYSLLTPNQIPCTVTAHFVGVQRIPC